MADKSPIQPASSLPLPTVRATGRNIPELACQHLETASLFRDHVVRIEAEHVGQVFGAFFGEIRSYGTACIMSSAAALEALINELFISHTSKLRALLNDFETQFWGKGGLNAKEFSTNTSLRSPCLTCPGLMKPARHIWKPGA